MNRKQAAGLIGPAALLIVAVTIFALSGEWSRAEWKQHWLFRSSELAALVVFCAYQARFRYVRNADPR
jgi:hypothetical protein